MTRTLLKNTTIFVIFTLLITTNISKAEKIPSVENYSCKAVPRANNTKLPLSSASNEWFKVYKTHPGVYSITEPFQIQETISHLIVGTRRAILFDTGVGLLSIKSIVEQITDLPVTVINSHTHYDHVGNNWEFSEILAVDTSYTRANMAGFSHNRIADDFYPEAFCKGVPKGVELSRFYVKPWQASGYIRDGDVIDLGERKIKILLTPGHTPDAITLLDIENRLLFTGDTWYDASLWLFVKETSISDYKKSIDHLSRLENQVDFLLGAHNSVRIASGPLKKLNNTLEEIISGKHKGKVDNYNRLVFDLNGIRILTSQQTLEGQQGELSKGGSGLDTWPTKK